MPFIKALIQATCLVFYIVEYVCLTCIFSLAKLLHATFMGPTPILLLILHIESKNTTKMTFEFAFVIVFIAPEDIHLFVFFMYCVVICIRCFTQTSFNAVSFPDAKSFCLNSRRVKFGLTNKYIWLNFPNTWPLY